MTGDQLTLGLLGPLEAYHDGAPVELGPPRRGRAILAPLALHAGRVVATTSLVDTLWEQDPPARAQHAIQVYISSCCPSWSSKGAPPSPRATAPAG